MTYHVRHISLYGKNDKVPYMTYHVSQDLDLELYFPYMKYVVRQVLSAK